MLMIQKYFYNSLQLWFKIPNINDHYEVVIIQVTITRPSLSNVNCEAGAGEMAQLIECMYAPQM